MNASRARVSFEPETKASVEAEADKAEVDKAAPTKGKLKRLKKEAFVARVREKRAAKMTEVVGPGDRRTSAGTRENPASRRFSSHRT